MKVLSIKDYIKNPKKVDIKLSYVSFCADILSDSVVDTKVEIQIRTIAMDFWASLEHKIYYKFEGKCTGVYQQGSAGMRKDGIRAG